MFLKNNHILDVGRKKLRFRRNEEHEETKDERYDYRQGHDSRIQGVYSAFF
jgi:hypothetical protein